MFSPETRGQAERFCFVERADRRLRPKLPLAERLVGSAPRSTEKGKSAGLAPAKTPEHPQTAQGKPALAVEALFEDVFFDAGGDEAVDGLAALRFLANVCGRDVGGHVFHQIHGRLLQVRHHR